MHKHCGSSDTCKHLWASESDIQTPMQCQQLTPCAHHMPLNPSHPSARPESNARAAMVAYTLAATAAAICVHNLCKGCSSSQPTAHVYVPQLTAHVYVPHCQHTQDQGRLAPAKCWHGNIATSFQRTYHTTQQTSCWGTATACRRATCHCQQQYY